jgi:deoxyribodipyrimidine photo-lyase
MNMLNIVWFRRDLRSDDNTALAKALDEGLPVLPLFIFDTCITDELNSDDARISFIHERLARMDADMRPRGGGILVMKGDPEKVFDRLSEEYSISGVFANSDYEPYAKGRDNKIKTLLGRKGIEFNLYKDQVIFEHDEILKDNKEPYSVFTPYSRKWLKLYSAEKPVAKEHMNPAGKLADPGTPFPSLADLKFSKSSQKVRDYDLSVISDYDKYRNIPAADLTSYLSPHLRFGTVSVRKIAAHAYDLNHSFMNELVWREFFMQILASFPEIVTASFRRKYDGIEWRNDETEFRRWCRGETGYPIVDAGMRQLNETGYMHNRVRMITASFLCKHLLTDWRWGEAYFAGKLLDYELSSNNGNWQWAAGTGCDAAPYFRVFSPAAQEKKFDPAAEYIRKWVREIGTASYPEPLVDHEFARKRAIEEYRKGLNRI